jgi:GNAT superfamily N-acetyltransferase
MAAASLISGRSSAHPHGGIHRTRLARDLYQIAELVEICFGERLDASGRSAVREMKMIARMVPVLWLFSLLNGVGLGLGTGYVWRSRKRVTGNVSLYRGGQHPILGRGFLIANVAVHPDVRRQGIARSLMEATLDLVERKTGNWVALQVEADNTPAIDLYRSMGFRELETLTQWETTRIKYLPSSPSTAWIIRERMPRDAEAIRELIFERARVGGMAWTRTIEQHDIIDPLAGLPGMSLKEQWVLPALHRHDTLMGLVWVEQPGWRQVRITQFLDPELEDALARRALLQSVLSRSSVQGRTIRVETTADDSPVDSLLADAGFRPARHLTQMRKLLEY